MDILETAIWENDIWKENQKARKQPYKGKKEEVPGRENSQCKVCILWIKKCQN